MYDDKIQDAVIGSLESEIFNIVNGIEILASQGYSVNECKKHRIRNANMLIHGFNNINILSHEQQHNLESIFNKISRI